MYIYIYIYISISIVSSLLCVLSLSLCSVFSLSLLCVLSLLSALLLPGVEFEESVGGGGF